MVLVTCANESCLYSFRADEDDVEEFPYCQWCLERKMKARLSLGIERDKAIRELRQPWRGYKYKHMPEAMVEKFRNNQAASANTGETLSPTQPVDRPAVGPPQQRRKGSLKATIAASPPPRSTSFSHPTIPGVQVDVYSTIEAEHIEGAVPVRGLPSLEKQLHTAESNLAKLRGSDPTSLATKAYLKEQIDKLKKDIYNSKSLAEQVDALQDRVARAEVFSQTAEKALKTAIEVKDSKQSAFDSATEVEENLRQQLDDLRQRLEREEDAARANAVASPLRRASEVLPDSATELISALKGKGNKELINQIFIQLATEAVLSDDLNIPQFTEHPQNAQTEFKARAAPHVSIPAVPAAPAAPVCPMETDETVRTVPPAAGLAAVPQMPSFSPIKGTENFNISSEGEEMTSMKHLSARPSTRPVQADNSWRQPPPSQDPSEQDRISTKVSLLKNEKLFNADGKLLSVIEIQQVLVKSDRKSVV